MKFAESDSEAAQLKPRSAALAFIFITITLDMLALGLIVPVLPKLVEDFLHGDTARAAEYVGLFGMVWAAIQFLFSPALGTASDRFGRRPIILLSNFGLGLDYVVMALAPLYGGYSPVGWLPRLPRVVFRRRAPISPMSRRPIGVPAVMG